MKWRRRLQELKRWPVTKVSFLNLCNVLAGKTIYSTTRRSYVSIAAYCCNCFVFFSRFLFDYLYCLSIRGPTGLICIMIVFLINKNSNCRFYLDRSSNSQSGVDGDAQSQFSLPLTIIRSCC